VDNHIGTWHRRTITTWVLIAGVLLQPVLTYLATPLVAEDGKGHYVLLCTLNGLQEVYVDDLPSLGEQSDDEHCPALKLLQLAGTAQPPAPLHAPAVTLSLVAVVDIGYDDGHSPRHSTDYPIRAPPMS